MEKTFSAIFDWDGVIIDSSEYHRRSWDRLAEELGRVLPEGHFKKGFGKKNEVIIPGILGWTNERTEIRKIADRKEEIYRELLHDGGIAPMAGVVELLSALKDEGIACGVGSSTPRVNIACVMDLTGLDEYFQTVVSAEDVHHGKPDPDVFLQVAKRLDAAPARSVVFEDAFVGIEAARNAGMRVVAVASTNAIEVLQLLRPDIAVQTLEEITVERLRALFE